MYRLYIVSILAVTENMKLSIDFYNNLPLSSVTNNYVCRIGEFF